MAEIDFIKLLRSFDRDFFTTSDLEKILELNKSSLKVFLSRAVKKGVLTRLTKGVYKLSIDNADTDKIANQLYYPSYLSFESALSMYGILSQIPYTRTFATLKKSKKNILNDVAIEFIQVKEELFFGYTIKNGIYIAEPEKALLDQIYLASRGKRNSDFSEFDTSMINKKIFMEYQKKYPKYIRKIFTLGNS